MNKAFVLVGVPGSGKSTYVTEVLLKQCPDATWISTDAFVETYAATQNKTYSEVFDEYMPTAVQLMADAVVQARSLKQDIIWDQTSTTRKSRKNKFRMLPDYQFSALVFDTPDALELDRRLSSRPGKSIPAFVVNSMIDRFQVPTLDEGFFEIRFITQKENNV